MFEEKNALLVRGFRRKTLTEEKENKKSPQEFLAGCCEEVLKTSSRLLVAFTLSNRSFKTSKREFVPVLVCVDTHRLSRECFNNGFDSPKP